MSKRKRAPGGLVYSSEHGRTCPACRQPLDACNCRDEAAATAGDGVVRVRRETKGRGAEP